MSETEIIRGSLPLNYSANDWFYLHIDKCNNPKDEQCVANKVAVQQLQSTSNSLGASMTQYNDAKMLYNRELLFTVNILAGLAMLCYYIYVNQNVFPDPTSVFKQIGDAGSSIASTGKT